jgi:hypothetical protein
MTLKTVATNPHRMPREIAPGVFWIGDCLSQRRVPGGR